MDNGDEKPLNSVYEIDGQTYVSVEELFKYLSIPVEDNVDGNINIGNVLNIQIGENKAKLGDNEILLDYEPIIYKAQVYMNSKDLEKVLKDNYNVELLNNKITLEYVGSHGNVKEAFAYEDGAYNAPPIGNKKAYAGSYGFSIIVIGLVLVILKNGKEGKNI